MKAIVAGASGLVGGELVAQLIADEQFEIIHLLGRRKIEKFASPKVVQTVCEFEKLSDLESIGAIDVGFCTLGTTLAKAGSKEAFCKVDFEYVRLFAELCKKLKVQKFILVSALGASSTSKIYYNRVKSQVEEELKKLNFFTLIILRPSLLLGERNEERLGEAIAQKFSPVYSPLLIGPLRKYRPITAKRVAKRMQEVAKLNNPSLQIIESEKI